ncbi:Tripeptidyl-peptidase sed2 [Cytospora mali]|uniref:tripeptidyl-peptidase II n=1 Tax=Cytospora mali TaxID=578113 RepID=A0A194V0K1_CYTMA|nr:Tripeptidyl-peptidase sed2 [Valsa mali var. pyri (nom. inval.)]
MLPLLAILSTAATVSARVFDTVPGVPRGWSKASPALPSDKVTLKVGLKQQHAAALEQTVLAVSTPGHSDYGKHLTREELRSYVAPDQQSVDNVTSWLAEYGITPAVDNDWVTFVTDVKTANELLDATFNWYQYSDGGSYKLRTLSYSVPDEVADHVDLIQPTTRFGHLGAKKSTIFDVTVLDDETVPLREGYAASADAAPCTTTVTPQCLKAQYNINYPPHLHHPRYPEPSEQFQGNLVAFASYLEQYARYSDLESFQLKVIPEAGNQNFSVTLIDGGLNDQASEEGSIEANLDVQYIFGVSHPIPIREYSTGGRGPLIPTHDDVFPSTNEPYLEFLTYMLNLTDDDLPQTLTTSYGEEEQSVPEEYALKVCNMFMQLGARGVSVLFSSGDSGPGKSCKSNVDNSTTTFLPTFPAGCPYVTAVGATTSSAPERGVYFSSGGFSIYHPRPAWQDEVVPAYLTSIGSTYEGLFNASGRGIPDVAAQGSSFVVVDKNRSTLVSGTSASSPVFAGVVALLNAARKSQGLPPLGFLNPWLYQNSGALLDITAGYSAGCKMAGGGLPRSGAQWNCTEGWDPVTGLGTPLFDQLLEAATPSLHAHGDRPCPGDADGVACQ